MRKAWMRLRSSMMVPSVLRQTALNCTRLCCCSGVSPSNPCTRVRYQTTYQDLLPACSMPCSDVDAVIATSKAMRL